MSETATEPEVTSSDDEKASLSERLAGAHVAIRSDLQVYRHLFRGEPSYVVRDPMTMQSHRFDLGDYQILIRIHADQSLGALFEALVASEQLRAEDEEHFYRFILELHGLDFLTLPVPNDSTLYKRYVRKQSARRAQQLKGILFLKVPLFNPDGFLDRTLKWVRPLFGRPFFICWLGMLAVSLFVVAQNTRELLQPSHGILDAGNLPFMWVSLIVLKLAHEFGHAYACKLRGGEVPEMGAFMVVFTPLAYVDATSAWSFVRRRDRLIVSLAGVYVESIFAMLALLVWISSSSAVIRMMAHDVMLLATVVTLVANANPLMRFDGYYVLSDLLEVPNLRARAEQQVRSALKRWLFGIRSSAEEGGRGIRAFLFAFGVSAAIYRVVLVFSISLVIASKAFLLGIAIAGSYAGSQLVNAVRSVAQYLLFAEETVQHRTRAVAIGVGLLVVLPVGVLTVPVPSSVRVSGQLGREFEEVVIATQPGFIRSIDARAGDRVETGALLASLENPELRNQLAEAEAEFELARLRLRERESVDPAGAQGARHLVQAKRAEIDRRRDELGELELRSQRAGLLVSALTPSDGQRFVRQNEPVATLASGSWRVRALLRGDELAATRPEIGQPVELRSPASPGETLAGRVVRVAPAGTRTVELQSLTQAAGGDIPVDDGSLEADQPYFEVVVELAEPDSRLRHGMTSHVQLAAAAEPLGVSGLRGLTRIINRISKD